MTDDITCPSESGNFVDIKRTVPSWRLIQSKRIFFKVTYQRKTNLDLIRVCTICVVFIFGVLDLDSRLFNSKRFLYSTHESFTRNQFTSSVSILVVRNSVTYSNLGLRW